MTSRFSPPAARSAGGTLGAAALMAAIDVSLSGQICPCVSTHGDSIATKDIKSEYRLNSALIYLAADLAAAIWLIHWHARLITSPVKLDRPR